MTDLVTDVLVFGVLWGGGVLALILLLGRVVRRRRAQIEALTYLECQRRLRDKAR